MDDGPRGVRALERRYQETGTPEAGLVLARAQGRAGDMDACFRTLCGIIENDAQEADHLNAMVAFRELLGDVWVDDSDPKYPGRWVLGYVAPGLPGSAPGACRFIVEDLDKGLLDGGQPHVQERFRVLARAAGRELQGLPDYIDQGLALYGAQDHPLIAKRIEAVRAALQSGIKKDQIFDSRTVWTPGDALDRFYAHDGGEGTGVALAGPQGALRDLESGLRGVSPVVFGTADVGAVGNVLGWIGRWIDTYILRFREQDKANLNAEVERVVGLVGGDGVVIDLDGGVNGNLSVGNSGGVARGWSRRCTRNF